MPGKRLIPLKDISSVAASGTVTINLPRGLRYHKIIVQHGYSAGTNTVAATATNVSEVRVLKDNKIQRRCTGTEWRDHNLIYGTQYDFTGVPNTSPGVAMTMHFAEPWRFDEVDQDALAWKTNLFQSFQMQLTLGAASTPTLVAWALVDDVQAKDVEAIVKWERIQTNASGTSYDYARLVAKEWLQSIHIYTDSGASQTPTPVTFKVGSDIYRDAVTVSAEQADLLTNGLTPTASGRSTIHDIVFDQDGLLGSALDLRGGGDTTLSVGAASAMSGTQVYLVKRLGPPE